MQQCTAELTLVAKEIQKSCNKKVKYQKAVPELHHLSKNFRPNMPSTTSIGPL